MALQRHGVVVERGDVGLAARQAGGHVAGLAVCAHTVVAVDVWGIQHRFLQGSHTHTHTGGTQVILLSIDRQCVSFNKSLFSDLPTKTNGSECFLEKASK